MKRNEQHSIILE